MTIRVGVIGCGLVGQKRVKALDPGGTLVACADVDINRASHAWNSGMRKGDIITSVNRKPVENLDAFFKLIEGKKNTLLLRIVRGRSAAFLVIR